jgi:hypothetical protein
MSSMKIVIDITKRKHVTYDAIIALILPLEGRDTLLAVLMKILVAKGVMRC